MKSFILKSYTAKDWLVLVVGLDAGLFVGIVAWLVGRGLAGL